MERSQRSERGASAVEMAFVAPFLLLLLLGIIEFGYVFGQFNEVRHAAREGARIAAVSNADFDQDGNSTFDANDIRLYVCDTINLPNASIDIDVALLGTTAVGQNAQVTVTANITSLSGAPLISGFVPGSIDNVAVFRLEQPATWSDQTFTAAC